MVRYREKSFAAQEIDEAIRLHVGMISAPKTRIIGPKFANSSKQLQREVVALEVANKYVRLNLVVGSAALADPQRRRKTGRSTINSSICSS